MDRLFVAPTFLAAATQAAALRTGLYGGSGRRVLLTTNNSAVPELTPSFAHGPGFARLARDFDAVVDLNDLLWPKHPTGWTPSAEGAERFRSALWDATGLAPGTGLTLQSLGVAPSRVLASVLSDSPIDVVSDGLMSYGPVRRPVSGGVAERLERLVHLDLVDGLEPLLFQDVGIRPELVPLDAFRAVVEDHALAREDAEELRALADGSTAVVLGQYLSALGLLTEDDEVALYRRLVDAAVTLGHERILFKPHPSAPPAQHEAVLRMARVRGVRADVAPTGVPIEVVFALTRPELVLGAFSTALMTASRVFDLPTAHWGAGDLATCLPDHANSNRIPLVLTAATQPRVITGPQGTRLVPPPEVDVRRLTRALAITMQPVQVTGDRSEAWNDADSLASEPRWEPFFRSRAEVPAATWNRSRGRLRTALVRISRRPRHLARFVLTRAETLWHVLTEPAPDVVLPPEPAALNPGTASIPVR